MTGALAGAANGFFGAGGGLFLVPLFTKWCGVPFGAMTSLLASFAAAGTDTSLLRRLFGVLLLYIGAKELFTKRKNPGTDPKPSSSNRVTRENHGGSPPRNP